MNKNDIFLKRPASVFGEKWRDGTPLGNGLTGVNLYGGAGAETFIVSRYDMWSSVGERLDETPNVSESIAKMRELAADGDYINASMVMYNKFKELGYKAAGQHMRCLCRVGFYFECPGVYSDYTRCLHMDTAEAEVTYALDKTEYRRKTFVSRDSDIVVSEFEFGKPLGFKAKADYFDSHEDGREDHIKKIHLENERYGEKDGFYIVTDGEGLTEATIVTATSEKFYEEHPELVKAFLTAQKQVLDEMDADHAAAVSATAKATGLEEAAVEEMYGLYDFDMEIKDSDIEAMEKTEKFMEDTGMIENPVDVASLILDVE